MATKLTLTLDPEVIRDAKTFAKRSGTSLSAIFENHLRLTLAYTGSGGTANDVPISPSIASLRGVARIPNQDAEADPKDEWHDYLSKKYA
jgi:hypothetical protein